MWRHVDVLLVAVVLVICAFGALMVYTATRDQLQIAGLSPIYYVKKQAIFMVLGVVVMVAFAAVDYRRWRALAVPIYGFCVLMLLAVYAVGHKSQGSQAWFQIGPYQLEPSAFATVGMIVVLATYLAARKGDPSLRHVAVTIVLFAVPFALIYKQPDLGTALILTAAFVAVLLVAGIRGRHLVALGLVAVIGLVGVVQLGVLKTYQRQRLTSFVNLQNQPNPKLLASPAGAALYNQAESKLTISNGGITGRGIGKGTQTNLSYVPSQRTDFIFTAVGEQVGLIGSGLLLLLFLLVVWRTWRTASLSRDRFGTLICVGVLGMIMFEVFENIGMTMGIMPVTGIPLPFMSYGGSAIIATFMGIGLVLSVRMRNYV